MAFSIEQTGLPAGVVGNSRTDGLDGGELVTLDGSGQSATTWEYELLWVPPGDSTAEASLGPVGPDSIWTFAPTPGAYGSYRIREVLDRGLSTESSTIRIFGVRTPQSGLLIPPLNTVADKNASLLLSGPAQVDASEDNAVDYGGDLDAFNYAGWWRALHQLFMAADSSGGGGGTPGGDNQSLQFNNAGAFGGADIDLVDYGGGFNEIAPSNTGVYNLIDASDFNAYVFTDVGPRASIEDDLADTESVVLNHSAPTSGYSQHAVYLVTIADTAGQVFHLRYAADFLGANGANPVSVQGSQDLLAPADVPGCPVISMSYAVIGGTGSVTATATNESGEYLRVRISAAVTREVVPGVPVAP